ncbi:MAG TPA: leucyl aminopeptidase [Nitrososphaeraceae archaeon]|nr:leucyl aminopeptidase [Nitrososphaeraceae archaeon]
MVQIKVEQATIDQNQTPLLVVGLYENENDHLNSQELDPILYHTIKEIISNKEFKAVVGARLIIPTMGKGPMKKIMLMGLGKKEKFNNEIARIVSAKAAVKVREMEISEFSILPYSNLDEGLIEAIYEGIALSLYSFNRYKTNDGGDESKVKLVTILINADKNKIQPIIDRTGLLVDAVNLARDLSNLPPNDCSPSQLASIAVSVGTEYGLKTRIIERYEMESLGLNGIVSVGKGSQNPPKLIILEYHGSTDDRRPYLLVGKGVTFDTGGISLKDHDKMDEMKFDKSGGCNVVAIMKAVASLKFPINVVGIIPSVENMPSSTSYRPGDIIKMYNGKTVEVLNTDAEGRLILADAIAFGIASYNPKAVIDLATLTGACIIALGTNVAAVIGTNKKFIDELHRVSDRTGEKIWELPLYEEFNEQIKSSIADIKNIGGRPGGAITAAAFLSNFTSGIPWIHIDIAGTAWTQEGTFERSYNPKGATGFGIRTLVKLLMEDSIFS